MHEHAATAWTQNVARDLPEEFFRHITTLQAIPRNGTPEAQASAVSLIANGDESGSSC